MVSLGLDPIRSLIFFVISAVNGQKSHYQQSLPSVRRRVLYHSLFGYVVSLNLSSLAWRNQMYVDLSRISSLIRVLPSKKNKSDSKKQLHVHVYIRHCALIYYVVLASRSLHSFFVYSLVL